MKNRYEMNIDKNEAYIYISNKVCYEFYGKEVICIIDLEDFEKVENYTWYIDSYGYVVSKSTGSTVRLHRILMKCPKGLTVDHIFHNPLDNRKSQLRIATQQEQNWNTGIPVHNTSGVKGVWFDKSRNKWKAEILNIKKKFTKRFETKEEAIKQRKEWEKEFFGDFNYKESLIS